MYKKNNLNSNSVNINNFNHIAKSNDLNKTPASGNSNNSININNNVMINNKHESETTKQITNLNMIFKFKTILNDEVNSKKNKIIKVDAKKVIRNNSINKSKNSNNNEKNSNILGNTNSNDGVFNIYKSQNSIHNKVSNVENHNAINVNNNTLKKKNDTDIVNKNKKISNMNSTLKSGNSTSKSKVKSSRINNEYKSNFDALKYSIYQLKDFLNPQNQTNYKIKNSKSRSKGKVSNMGVF